MNAQTETGDPVSSFRRIADRLATDRTPGLGLDGKISVGRVDVSGNLYSRTARIEFVSGSGKRAVYVKLPLVDANNRDLVHDRLRHEYAMLERLTLAFAGTPALSVVRPVAYLPDWPALVTEETAGPTLQFRLGAGTRIMASSQNRRDLESLCNLSGKWLKIFQTETTEQPAQFNLGEVGEYCVTRLAQIEAVVPDYFPAGFADRFVALLGNLSAATGGAASPLCARHNDFAPHNVIAADNSLCVLDFTMVDIGHPAFDLANFWERLAYLATDPLRPSAGIDRLLQALLAGYGDPGAPSSPAFRIARCKYRLTQIASIVQNRDGSPLEQWQARRLAASYRRWLIAQCDRH